MVDMLDFWEQRELLLPWSLILDEKNLNFMFWKKEYSNSSVRIVVCLLTESQ